MLAAGLLKLGFLTRFISNAVLRGFLTGIGVNIILGQLGDLTGYSSEYGNKVVKAIDTFLHLGQLNYQILLVGVVTVVLIVVLDRLAYLNKVSLLIALIDSRSALKVGGGGVFAHLSVSSYNHHSLCIALANNLTVVK